MANKAKVSNLTNKVTKQNTKDIKLSKITWRKFTSEGLEIHEVTNVDEYRKEGIQVMVLPAKRKSSDTFYVAQSDYDKVTPKRSSKVTKVTAELKGVDLTKLTTKELAVMQSKLAALLG